MPTISCYSLLVWPSEINRGSQKPRREEKIPHDTVKLPEWLHINRLRMQAPKKEMLLGDNNSCKDNKQHATNLA